jgi:hypothetical protein
LHNVRLYHTCVAQREREDNALNHLHSWDVDLLEDEQWGRVLVAQRDFEAGEIILRQPWLFPAGATVKDTVNFMEAASLPHGTLVQSFIDWAASSPR